MELTDFAIQGDEQSGAPCAEKGSDKENNAATVIKHTVTAANTLAPSAKRITIFGYKPSCFFVAMIVFSFFGFCGENAGRIAVQKVFDCRHQLLPFLFAYGFALLAIFIVLGTPQEMRLFGIKIFRKNMLKWRILAHLLYFAIIFFFVLVGEIAVGTLYEKCAGAVLWDYSDIPLNITRYTSIPTSLLYGGGAYALMAFAFKPLMRLIQKLGDNKTLIICSTLGAAVVADFIATVCITFICGAAPDYWAIYF